MKRVLAAIVGMGALGAALPAGAEAPKATFERTFSLAGAPKALHAKVKLYDAEGKAHALELWREGDRRVRRSLDGAVDTIGTRSGEDFSLAIVDKKQRRAFVASRASLARLGAFESWHALASMLAKPRGDVVIASTSKAPSRVAGEACAWIHVSAPSGASDVCWSAAKKLPLRVERDGKPALEVTSVETTPIPASTFELDRTGLRVVNADEDLSPSSD